MAVSRAPRSRPTPGSRRWISLPEGALPQGPAGARERRASPGKGPHVGKGGDPELEGGLRSKCPTLSVGCSTCRNPLPVTDPLPEEPAKELREDLCPVLAWVCPAHSVCSHAHSPNSIFWSEHGSEQNSGAAPSPVGLQLHGSCWHLSSMGPSGASPVQLPRPVMLASELLGREACCASFSPSAHEEISRK